MKKGESSRFRDEDKNQYEFSLKDEDHTSQRPQTMIREIRMITGGSFRSLKKAC